MLGVALADNMLLLFVFWELTSLSSYMLIGFEHERETARAAAQQAFLITAGGGLALLAGLLLLGQVGGTLELSALLRQGDVVRTSPFYLPAVVLILVAAFTKSAQFPFHFWLPNAMEAPTPVSAYLHSATMVKAGVYLLARLGPVLNGTDLWLYGVSGVGAATMLLGAYLALLQTDLKRLLAYSTVSALGMLTLLIGLGSPHALEAAVVLLLAHGLYKGTLFLVAGALDHETGTRDITQLGGLFPVMKLTALGGGLAALSMAGLPPLNRFHFQGTVI
jgi:multicomponent Na+:H+ antiporter subunit A